MSTSASASRISKDGSSNLSDLRQPGTTRRGADSKDAGRRPYADQSAVRFRMSSREIRRISAARPSEMIFRSSAILISLCSRSSTKSHSDNPAASILSLVASRTGAVRRLARPPAAALQTARAWSTRTTGFSAYGRL